MAAKNLDPLSRQGEHVLVTAASVERDWDQHWQFLTIWREAKSIETFNVPIDDLPPGKWEVDVSRGDAGIAVIVPKWSDGSIVHQARYFRCYFPGMSPGSVSAQLYVQLQID